MSDQKNTSGPTNLHEGRQTDVSLGRQPMPMTPLPTNPAQQQTTPANQNQNQKK